MKYIIQTLPYSVFEEAKKINILFENGLDVIHIRKPDYSNKKIMKIIDGIDSKYHNKIVLHNNYSLIKKYSLKGIHVDFSKLNNLVGSLYYKYLKKRYSLTISSNVINIDSENINNSIVDYVFSGPVYTKFTETSIVLNKNLFTISSKINKVNKEVYAINCFTINNIKATLNAGFTGPVLQSFIWKSEDIINAFKTLRLNFEVESNFDKIAI